MGKLYVESYVPSFGGKRIVWDITNSKKDALDFLACNRADCEPLVEVYEKNGEIKKGENK